MNFGYDRNRQQLRKMKSNLNNLQYNSYQEIIRLLQQKNNEDVLKTLVQVKKENEKQEREKLENILRLHVTQKRLQTEMSMVKEEEWKRLRKEKFLRQQRLKQLFQQRKMKTIPKAFRKYEDLNSKQFYMLQMEHANMINDRKEISEYKDELNRNILLLNQINRELGNIDFPSTKHLDQTIQEYFKNAELSTRTSLEETRNTDEYKSRIMNELQRKTDALLYDVAIKRRELQNMIKYRENLNDEEFLNTIGKSSEDIETQMKEQQLNNQYVTQHAYINRNTNLYPRAQNVQVNPSTGQIGTSMVDTLSTNTTQLESKIENSFSFQGQTIVLTYAFKSNTSTSDVFERELFEKAIKKASNIIRRDFSGDGQSEPSHEEVRNGDKNSVAVQTEEGKIPNYNQGEILSFKMVELSISKENKLQVYDLLYKKYLDCKDYSSCKPSTLEIRERDLTFYVQKYLPSPNSGTHKHIVITLISNGKPFLHISDMIFNPRTADTQRLYEANKDPNEDEDDKKNINVPEGDKEEEEKEEEEEEEEEKEEEEDEAQLRTVKNALNLERKQSPNDREKLRLLDQAWITYFGKILSSKNTKIHMFFDISTSDVDGNNKFEIIKVAERLQKFIEATKNVDIIQNAENMDNMIGN